MPGSQNISPADLGIGLPIYFWSGDFQFYRYMRETENWFLLSLLIFPEVRPAGGKNRVGFSVSGSQSSKGLIGCSVFRFSCKGNNHFVVSFKHYWSVQFNFETGAA
jgi:hypothetical protein